MEGEPSNIYPPATHVDTISPGTSLGKGVATGPPIRCATCALRSLCGLARVPESNKAQTVTF